LGWPGWVRVAVRRASETAEAGVQGKSSRQRGSESVLGLAVVHRTQDFWMQQPMLFARLLARVSVSSQGCDGRRSPRIQVFDCIWLASNPWYPSWRIGVKQDSRNSGSNQMYKRTAMGGVPGARLAGKHTELPACRSPPSCPSINLSHCLARPPASLFGGLRSERGSFFDEHIPQTAALTDS
jgi:hypothetical protein